MRLRLLICALVLFSACRRHPKIESLSPAVAPGGQPFVLTVGAQGSWTDVAITIDGQAHSPRLAPDGYVLEAGPLRRGRYDVRLSTAEGRSPPFTLDVQNSLPILKVERDHLALPGDDVVIRWSTEDFDADAVTVEVVGVQTQSANEVVIPTDKTTEGVKVLTLVARDDFSETRTTVRIETTNSIPMPTVLPPKPVRGGLASVVDFAGTNFTAGSQLFFDGVGVTTTVHGRTSLSAILPARPRGKYTARLERGSIRSSTVAIDVQNSTPVVAPVDVTIAEQQFHEIEVAAQDPDGDELTVTAVDLPPGAQFENGRVRFRPDFIQGGRRYRGTLVAHDGTATGSAAITIEVTDTIQPPMPTVVSSSSHDDHDRIVLTQPTDDFLDRPDRAGREFEATLVAPTSEQKLPLRVYLHGFGGSPFRGGRGDQYCVYPFDSDRTYWWGYVDENDRLTPYTARRVLHLVEYVLKTYPNADPDRVYLFGSSMGGAGATTIGAKFARHFAYAEATMGQMIPRLHRPLRIEQLTTHWGAPSKDWDDIDVVRLLVESTEARELYFHTRHGKDDPIIHFGAVLSRSPTAGVGYYEVLQRERIGHFAAWDEGAHGPPDPELGSKWWTDDWDPALDEQTYLARNRAFVAFTHADHDDDPGRPEGDGTREYDADRGFSGELEVVGDQGWGGDRAGTLNRHLRWRTPTILDEWHRFGVELRSAKPTTVDVTPRRTRHFRPRANEEIRWTFGDKSGATVAGPDGAVTIERLPIPATWQTLYLLRDVPALRSQR